jgi:hypothetical protein
MSLSARDMVEILVDVMQRADADWCALHGHKGTDNEEWDNALGDAEEWLEENL